MHTNGKLTTEPRISDIPAPHSRVITWPAYVLGIIMMAFLTYQSLTLHQINAKLHEPRPKVEPDKQLINDAMQLLKMKRGN